MNRRRESGWQFMIVLQDGSLPQVWQEYHGLRCLLTKEERLTQRWGERQQSFELVNDIQCCYGETGKKRLTIHLVVCRESWQEVDAKGTLVQRSSTWAWISDLPFSRETAHVRCNLGGRHRWGIEEGFLVEKRQGYDYEHCYAENWNAMGGHHYLMRIGHLLDLLASFTSTLIEAFKERGAQGFIAWLSSTLSGRWLDASRLQAPSPLPSSFGCSFRCRTSPFSRAELHPTPPSPSSHDPSPRTPRRTRGPHFRHLRPTCHTDHSSDYFPNPPTDPTHLAVALTRHPTPQAPRPRAAEGYASGLGQCCPS